MLTQFIANLAGSVKKVTANGRAYLVAPLSMIVPGVLNGSKGSLYYPEDEVAKSAPVWNKGCHPSGHVPIVVYHPVRNGQHVSAAYEGVLAEQGIGFVKNARYHQGKLRAEGWFDVEQTRNCDRKLMREGRPTILNRLEKGEPIELSTGLFTDNHISAGVSPTGRQYDAIARNYRSDHLAVLPDQQGACNLGDGCGVGVVNMDPVDNGGHMGPGLKHWDTALKNVHTAAGGTTEDESDDSVSVTNEEVPMSRKDAIAKLTANCSCDKGRAAVANLANNVDVPDETLVSMAAFVGNGVKIDADPKTGRLVVNAAPPQAAVGGPPAKQVGGEELDDEAIETVGENPAVAQKPVPGADRVPAQVGNAKAKPKNAMEWLTANNAPPEIVQGFQFTEQVVNEAKAKIVQQLVANVQDNARRQALGQKLMGESLPNLKERLEMMPVSRPQPSAPVHNSVPEFSYLGGGFPNLIPTDNAANDDLLMDTPTLNYAEISKEYRGKMAS